MNDGHTGCIIHDVLNISGNGADDQEWTIQIENGDKQTNNRKQKTTKMGNTDINPYEPQYAYTYMSICENFDVK